MTDDTYYAAEATTQADDNGFLIRLDDDAESQIEASGVKPEGFDLALGHLLGNGWGEVKLDWNAAQTLADELNALLRQSRVNGWN